MNRTTTAIKRYFKVERFSIMIVGAIVLGLLLRLIPDSHEIIWSFDQARDSFVMREMILNFDLKLIGPQTEYYGLFHGPLFYYLIGPFLFLRSGEVDLALIAMSFLTFSSTIPLSLLVYDLTKSRNSILVTTFIFAISYQLIEYGRWISNVSVAIPFLSWSYYFYYKVLGKKVNKRYFLLLGISIGLASQGELFLLSLAGIIFLVLLIKKTKMINLFYYAFGGMLGILPLLISELRFRFRGIDILATKILRPSVGDGLQRVFQFYFEHIEVTVSQVLGGFNMKIVIAIIAAIIYSTYYLVSRGKLKITGRLIVFVGTILISHLSLFFLSFVNSVFLDMEISLLLVLVVSVIITLLFKENKVLGITLLIVLTMLQIVNYQKYVIFNRPLDHYGFIQQPSTLSHKEEIVNTIYDKANGKEFTFASVGTPFGVRTVWASVFEIYSKHNNVNMPKWYGYHANGYPGEELLEVVDKPAGLHVLLIESNIDNLLAKPIIDQEISNQDNHTTIIEEVDVYDTKIQFRKNI